MCPSNATIVGQEYKLRFDVFYKPMDATKIPDSLDWSALGAVTPVHDQGFSCRSCWAFAAVG